MSGRGSKAKGNAYEVEVAAYIAEGVGLDCRRALLSGGGRNDGGADLDGTPLVHMELKRVESFSPYKAMGQAEEAISKARDKSVKPVVVTRRNRMRTGESLVVMRLDDWLPLYQMWIRSTASGQTASS